MKVLVTGASGFVGRHLLPQLLSAGHDVRALVHHNVADVSCETIAGHLPNPALCETLCANVDAVVHAAGVAHVNADEKLLREQNLDATLELAASAKARGVTKFIFLSSSKARYPAHSTYARLKAEAERKLLALHEPGSFEIVCLRPALVYGIGMRGNLRSLLRMLAKPQLPLFVASSNRIGLISVHDLSRAITAALSADALPAQAWEISDGDDHTLTKLISNVRTALGLQPPLITLPRPLFRAAASLAEFAAPIVPSALSMSTYRTLFEETYEPDMQFSQHTGFAVQDAFLARLPELLEDVAA